MESTIDSAFIDVSNSITKTHTFVHSMKGPFCGCWYRPNKIWSLSKRSGMNALQQTQRHRPGHLLMGFPRTRVNNKKNLQKMKLKLTPRMFRGIWYYYCNDEGIFEAFRLHIEVDATSKPCNKKVGEIFFKTFFVCVGQYRICLNKNWKYDLMIAQASDIPKISIKQLMSRIVFIKLSTSTLFCRLF